VAVKKLPEIGDAFLEIEWEEADKGDADYQFLERLHQEGRHPIQVGRSTFVIEQCESGDPLPHPHAEYALRITVHGDKAMHSDEDVFYMWGGRYGMASGGIHHVGGASGGTTPYDRSERAQSRVAIPAIRTLLEGIFEHAPTGSDGEPVDDARYRELWRNAIDAIDALARHLGERNGR
jgi:hypothetical protein